MRIFLPFAFLLAFAIPQALAQAPVAGFEASATEVYSGTTVTFTDLSTNSPTAWAWDFGAEAFPRTSAAQHPKVAWATPGTYNISLTVSNASGSDARTISGYITVVAYSTPAVNPVEIGSGTTAGQYPLSSGQYPQSAALYTADEIGPGTIIESLSWHSAAADASIPVEIFLKHTTDTSLGPVKWSQLVGGESPVFAGTVNHSGGWTELTLHTPFRYDGVSNLLVMGFSNANTGKTTSSSGTSSNKPDMHLVWTGNPNSPKDNNGTVTPNRPDLRIRFQEYESPVASLLEGFFEDFEGDQLSSSGWVISERDGNNNTWDHSTSYNHTPEGMGAAYHAGGSKNYNEKGLLISPSISLPQGAATLSFWSKNINTKWFGRNSVGIISGSDTTEVWVAASGTDSWVQTNLALDAFGGQQIQVVFQYEGDGGHGWYLDDVAVNTQSYRPITVDQGQKFLLKDYSSGNPVLWEWTTPGATPEVQYTRDATLVYDQPGWYDVTLRVGNTYGTNTRTVTGFIQVLGDVVTHTTWQGTTDSQWTNSSNWDNGVPANGQDVVIHPGSHQPLLNEDAVTGNLTINDNACLTIGPQGKLNVKGTLTNLAGAQGLILESDASLIHSTTDIAATVKRTVSGGWGSWDDGWHLISAPVRAQPLTTITTSGAAGDDYDLYGWDEPSATWKNYKATGFSDWNGGTDMTPGRGYLISFEAAETHKTFEGVLNVEDIAITNLTLSGDLHSGWHLLGNPFAADMTWNDHNWKLSGVAAKAKIWSEAGMSYVDIDENGIIPMAQGFMIQVTSGTNTLTLPAASRRHSNQPWYKNQDIRRIRLVAREQDNRSFQESQIVINPGTPSSFDLQHDSRFLAGYAPQFFSMKADEKLSTLSMPYVYDGMMIPMGFIKNGASAYEIALVEELYGTELYLFDTKLSVSHPLRRLNPYVFTSEEGDDPLRFELHFGQEKAAGILDASPLSLQVYAQGNQLHVTFTEEGNGRSLEVYDMSGRRLVARDLDEGLRHVLSLNLPGAVYLVRVIMAGQVVTRKVVVESH